MKEFIGSKEMPHAGRGGGNQTTDGGKPECKPMSYTPPKGPTGIQSGGGKHANHGTGGTQHKG